MSTKRISQDLPDQVQKDESRPNGLPLNYRLKLGYLFSLLIAVLTALAAIAGLVFPNDLYPSSELQQFAVANDVITLLVGLPILLGTMWLSRRRKLIGLLFWPGALSYGLYNYLAYLFGMPLNVIYPVYLIIVTLSLYTIIGLVAGIDREVVKERLNGQVPERFGGGILVAFGILFMLRSLGEMAQALASQTPIPRIELALLVTDFIVTGAWVIGGMLLWRRQALGYVGGTGLLFQGSMLFAGVIFIMLLQPVVTGAPFIIGDFIFIVMMGLICFVPLVLFWRGIVKT